MRLTRFACLVVTSALLGCGGGGGDDGGTTNPPPPPPPPNTQTLGSISTNPTSMNLLAGNTQAITVSAFDAAGAVIVNPGTPVFSSASLPSRKSTGRDGVRSVACVRLPSTCQCPMGGVKEPPLSLRGDVSCRPVKRFHHVWRCLHAQQGGHLARRTGDVDLWRHRTHGRLLGRRLSRRHHERRLLVFAQSHLRAERQLFVRLHDPRGDERSGHRQVS